MLRLRNSDRRVGFGLVEISIAVVILALSVPSLVDLARSTRLRGLGDETLLTVHFKARNALLQAVDAGRRDGFAASAATTDDVEVSIAPEEKLAGLWRVTVTATAPAANGKTATYSLSRLAADPRSSIPEIDKEQS